MSWRRILPVGLTLTAVLLVSAGCETGSLIDGEMWRINLILEEARGKSFEKRMQESYQKSKKTRVKLLKVREKAQTWAEEIDSLETKIAFMEKSREPLRQKAEKWEADGEQFLMKAVELKSKSDQAREQMVAAQGKLEEVKAEMESLPQSQKDLLARWNALKAEIDALNGKIEDGRENMKRLEQEKKDNEVALENLRLQASGSAEQLNELKKALAKKGRLHEEIEKAKREIGRLAKEKMGLDGRKEKLAGEVRDRENALKPIKENNELLKQMSRDLAEETKKIRGESTRLLMEKGDLESQVKALEDDIERLEREIEELKRKKREKEKERDGAH